MRTSSRPRQSIASSIIRAAPPGRLRSTRIGASLWSAMTTSAPPESSMLAIAAPIPEAPPVTRAPRPDRLIGRAYPVGVVLDHRLRPAEPEPTDHRERREQD